MTTSIPLRVFFATSALKKYPGKRRELMERTTKVFPLDDTPKALKNQGFSGKPFQSGHSISSQPRYDHFDTAAYSAVQARLAPLRRGLFRIADCFKKIKSFGDLFSQFSLQAQEGAQGPAVAGPRRGSRSSALLSRSDDVPHSVQDHGRAVGVGFQRLRRGDA